MDDLSGLEWSTKSNNGAQQPKQPVMNPSYSSFRPSPSSPFASGRNTPLSAQGSGSAATTAAPPKAAVAPDSFSNLVSFGPAKAKQNLSLAERQAQLEEEKRRKEEEKRKLHEAQFGNAQFWDTLGNRGASTSPALQQPFSQPPAAATTTKDDDDLFAAFNKDTKVDKTSHYPPPESQRSTPANAAPIDLSNPTAWASTTSNGGGLSVEDDDPFGLNEIKPAKAAAPAQQVNDDDDFLGDLGRPVEEVRRKQKATQPAPEPGKPIENDESSSSEDQPPPRPQRRTRQGDDPFDKAVAQLVAYGFSPEDAQRGLTESGAGTNVQAAANWLLDDAHRKSKAKAQGRSTSANSERPPRTGGRSPARGEPDLAKQAAAVGNSLFKTANSLWKTGQKSLQKAVADFQQDGGDPSQPKWMRDAQQQQSRGSSSTRGNANSTNEALALEADGRPQRAQPQRTNGRAAAEQRPSQPSSRGPSPALSAGSRASPAPRWQQQSPAPGRLDSRSRLNRLADDDSFSYSSSNRRKKTPQPQAPAPELKMVEPEPDLFNTHEIAPSQSLPQRPAQRSTPQPAKRPSPPAPTPSPRPARQIPSISPIALQTSTQHRIEGTTHFKRGDYAAAHSSYSSSLATVPPTHPLTIVLLTNRALTALKTGEPKQAVDDADTALKLIGPGNGKGEAVAVKGENGQDENRDMKDLYGKALSRKAEALEQMEKWADASIVWQLCVEGGVGGSNAIKGRQRCQTALAPKPKPAPKPAARPRPKPSAVGSLTPSQSSEAVTRLRQANEAAAREDDEKFALSEKVDAKVSAWRDGKRDNLRALLGSMDQVLWENSGWKKVGLHELVMVNKVKINYMKAIAKTHPDKVSPLHITNRKNITDKQ